MGMVGQARSPSRLDPAGSPGVIAGQAQARVAILAPLSGPNSERGQALVQAAQLALTGPGSPSLDVKDTRGTAEGAASAASEAIAGGAGLIIGPLTGAETGAAAVPAGRAGVPILAFTNDTAQSRPGVWTLGITPAQQVRRLVAANIAEGKSRFAGLLPQNAFGGAMADALNQATSAAGVAPPSIRRYGSSMASMTSAVRELSGHTDADVRRVTPDTTPREVAPAPFDSLLLADVGDPLAQITALLPRYDLTSPAVRVLGPVLWAAPATRGGSDLTGAWYAAPDPASRSAFDQAFQAKYGAPAPGLADVAYDAASIARVIAPSGFSTPSLTRPDGYAGVDGVLALGPDGRVRRGLRSRALRPCLC